MIHFFKEKYNYLYLIISLIFLIYFGVSHLHIIFFPNQLEYREGAALLIVSEILKGNFPYTLKMQPYLSEVYGPIYYFISALFVKFLGLKLASLRLLSAICIFENIFLFYYFNRRRDSSILLIAYCIIFYSHQLFMCIPIARPDSLGLFFFILSIGIPFKSNFNKKSMLLSLLFSLLAFYTKVYFVIGFVFVLFYLFCFHSIKRSLNYFILFFSCIATSLLFLNYLLDFYFLSIFSSHLTGTVYDFSQLLNQLNFYFKDLLLVISILFLLYVFIKVFRMHKISLKKNDELLIESFFNFRFFDEPFFRHKHQFSYLFYLFLMGFLLLIFKMGGHTGQFGVYFIQFLSFPILSLSFQKFHKPFINYPLISLTIVSILFYNSYTILPKYKDYDKSKLSFNKSLNHIKFNKRILSTPLFASNLINTKKYVYASGLTEYMCYASRLKNNYGLPKPISILKDKVLLGKIRHSEDRWSLYVNEIHTKVRKKYFDLIIMDTSVYDDWLITRCELEKSYKLIDSSSVYMSTTYQTFFVYFYEPKFNLKK